MTAEEQLAKRAIRTAKKRWGSGWSQLAPEAQTYQAYAACFVLITTEDLQVDLRLLAQAILQQLHGE